MKIAGCILAGGRSSRFGSDKALVSLNGKTLLQHAIARLSPQVARTVINTNSLDADYALTGLPVIADKPQNYDGPLAGVLAGLAWAKLNGMDAVVTAAVDTPLFPIDLVAKLRDADGKTVAVARSASGLHPTFALWPLSFEFRLQTWLAAGGSRKVTDFLCVLPFRKVSFKASGPLDPFFNINTEQDLRVISTQVKME